MRQVYRIELSGSFHLRGILRLEGDVGIEGRLADISTKGAALAFLPGSDPNLELDSELEMVFEGPNGVQVETKAIVRSRFEGDSFIRYGFEFANIEELNKRIPILMRAVFNRRRSPRVQPDTPVAVTLEAEGTDTITANLVNISVSGAAIEVPFTAFENYVDGGKVTTTLDLPEALKAVCLKGSIRGIRMQGPSVHLGIEFSEDTTPHWEEQVAQLENYVCSREVLSPYVPG